MARTYYVRGPTTFAEGHPLDAHTTRTLVQRNIEAVYEEARQDVVCVLPQSEQVAAGWYQGPAPILVRLDRDGLWRSQQVQPLCCGGTSQRTLRCFLTAGNATPSTTPDPYVDFTIASGSTNIWQTAQSIPAPRGWWPWPIQRYPAGDEDGFVAVAWIVFLWTNWFGLNPPQFAGWRLIEQVDV